MADPWPLIHAERRALLADVDGLTEAQWSTPSLCALWSVRDVLAHMTATAKMTPPRFIGQMATSGFRFNAMTAKGVREERGATPGEAVAAFRAQVDSTKHPPGPLDAMVGEALIHSEDIRRPLGIRRHYPAELTTAVAAFVVSGNLLLGGKRRSAGLCLRATDAEWTHGSGPEVAGPLASIVLALTGRRAGLADLTGDGVDTLAARVPS